MHFTAPNLTWDGGIGTNLKGNDGANGTNGTNGANGTNGTNGNTVLNGFGRPALELGVDGDFYIDISTYSIYGPKIGGNWGSSTSLKGADGNSNIIALETGDAFTFFWKYDSNDANALTRQGAFANDTTSVFNIPAANVAAAKAGIVMVYLRKNEGAGAFSWKQLNYTEASSAGTNQLLYYNYNLRIDATTAKVRITYKNGFGSTHTPITVDKVRIVIAPASATGALGNTNQNMPMLQTMQKLRLSDKDFQKLN